MKKIILASLLAASICGVAFAGSAAKAAEAESRYSGNAKIYPVSSIVITGNNGGTLTCAWQDVVIEKRAGWICTQGGAGVGVQTVAIQGDSNVVTCSPTESGAKPKPCTTTVTAPTTP